MFNPKTKAFLLGHVDGVGKGKKGIRSSHAEEYYEVVGSNAGYDDMVRGWIGTGKSYPHGVIHFAPPVTSYNFDKGMDCLEVLKKCGAQDMTLVRGFPTVWEQPLKNILESVIMDDVDDVFARAFKLLEAERAPNPVVDIEALKTGFKEVSAKLASQHGLKWESTWIEELKKLINQRKVAHESSADDDETPFDASEAVAHLANRVYYHNPFIQVRKEVAGMVDEYQHRMAKDPDDVSDYIESSDYLTSMYAQEECAKYLVTFDPEHIQEYALILRKLKNFADSWVIDQNYEPVICAPMYQGLCEFLPFVLFVLTAGGQSLL